MLLYTSDKYPVGASTRLFMYVMVCDSYIFDIPLSVLSSAQGNANTVSAF